MKYSEMHRFHFSGIFSDEPGISYRPSLHLTNAIEAQKEYRNTDEMRLLTISLWTVWRGGGVCLSLNILFFIRRS